jgi:hydroxymethylpyrimidine pyrophosphatase-like HAD family hydrolase
MAVKLTRLAHKIAIPSGRELYHLQFSFQGASPETFGYTLVCNGKMIMNGDWVKILKKAVNICLAKLKKS